MLPVPPQAAGRSGKAPPAKNKAIICICRNNICSSAQPICLYMKKGRPGQPDSLNPSGQVTFGLRFGGSLVLLVHICTYHIISDHNSA